MGRNDNDDDPGKVQAGGRSTRCGTTAATSAGNRRASGRRSLRSEWAKKQHLKQAEKFSLGKKEETV